MANFIFWLVCAILSLIGMKMQSPKPLRKRDWFLALCPIIQIWSVMMFILWVIFTGAAQLGDFFKRY
jgi:hypothetical protein